MAHNFRWRGYFGLAAILTALLLGGCGDEGGGSSTPTPTPTAAERRYLFLLYSDAGELLANGDGTYLFRLTQVWDTVVAFTDRPFRDAISTPLRDWIANWGANGFTDNPPNAAITMLVDESVQNTDWAVMTLRNPRFTGDGTLEFDSEFLRLPDGKNAFFPTVLGSGVKPVFTTTQLFIDSTGDVIPPPDQLSWQVNGRTELMLNLAATGYSPSGGDTLVIDDPEARFCTAPTVRPSVRLALDPQACAQQDCTIEIGAAVTTGQIPIVRIPGAAAGSTASVTITTYEGCDASRPLTLTIANGVHYQGLTETPLPTATMTATSGAAGTATPTSGLGQTPTPTVGPCSIETELGISAAGGWLPLNDPACTRDGLAEIGSAGCPRAWIDGAQARAFGETGLRSVRVHGNGILAIEDNFEDAQGPVTLDVSRIEIAPIAGDPAGSMPKLIVGTEKCPIRDSRVTLRFRGEPLDSSSPDYLRSKGIIVKEGGELILHGAAGVVPHGSAITDRKGTVSWTYLTAPAGPAKWSKRNSGIAVPVPAQNPATTLQLSRAVEWREGDWIVVASTDFAEDHQEIVQIAEVLADPIRDVATIRLNPDTPLTRYHFGGPAPSLEAIPAGLKSCNGVPLDGIEVTGLPGSFCDGPDRNFGVDERAEVGLLSRSIKLTAVPAAADPHYGGQIRIEPGVGAVAIEGVELENFGQAISLDGHQSGYPIHFHHVGTAPAGTVVNSNSIHHSFNKCVTLHDTDGVRVEHNVCVRNIGHSFYLELGTETDNVFYGNLAAGAMAPKFVPQFPDQMWPGDYLARGAASTVANGYNGIDVAQPSSPDHGELLAPTGFWIAHPRNTFQHNSVAGCQFQGRGYWIMPQTTEGSHSPFPPAGFDNNRVHGCYGGIDSGADAGAISTGFVPQIDGKDAVATLTNVTVTRIRNKGVWLRPGWYHVDGARVATSRDGISLVSAGGVEGSPPGEWALLSNSVLVGISANNPERFGPCPQNSDRSCYGLHVAPNGLESRSANSFPDTHWNVAGFMFYDGPARLDTIRFVNFNVDIQGYLTADDRLVLSAAKPPYEGDAALGWFQSNVNNYPPTQYTTRLLWENTDFRHQVYTEEVNLAAFVDGDKNTVILDRDGTLSGFMVIDENGDPVPGRFPISLNNLEFNAIAPAEGPLTVDECGALGAQDAIKENRPTALMSPEAYATLELTAWDPTLPAALPPDDAGSQLLSKKAPLTFIKDQQDFVDHGDGTEWNAHHYDMTLVGRNVTQVREPKVMRGAGYSVHSFKEGVAVGAYANGKPVIARPHALPRFVSAVLTDVSSGPTAVDGDREVFVKPFRIRLGLCYRAEGGHTPTSADSFKVERGRVSLGGPIGQPNSNAYTPLACNNFLFQDSENFRSEADADPETIAPSCPAQSTQLAAAPDWETFEREKDGFFYDAKKGMLFVYVEQDEANAVGAAPIGSCRDDSTDIACAEGRDFYSCPPGGCVLYTVRVTDEEYKPLTGNYGPTICDDIYEGDREPDTENRDYTEPYPPNGIVDTAMDRLAYLDGTPVQELMMVSTNPAPGSDGGNFPHVVFTGDESELCPIHRTGPINTTPVPVQASFTIAMPGGDNPYVLTSVTFESGGTKIESTTNPVTLDLDTTWKMTLRATYEGVAKVCMATIVTGPATAPASWSSTDGSQCLLPPRGDATISTGPF